MSCMCMYHPLQVGSLSTTSADEVLYFLLTCNPVCYEFPNSHHQEQVDDSVMIRKHFVGRIAELNKQVGILTMSYLYQ